MSLPRRTPMPRPSKPLRSYKRIERRTRIKPRSAKQARANRIRRQMVADMIEQRGRLCQAQVRGVCRNWADDCHEPLTRGRGGSIVDPENALLVCRPCHDYIHANPEDAARLSLLVHSWDRWPA